MGNMQAHDLHQMVRTWLLSEDPYGLNSGSGSMQGGRIEPYFGEAPHQAQTDTESAVARALTPTAAGRQNPARAAWHGQNAVANELDKPDPRASEAGQAAVDAEVDKHNTELWRAHMAGRKADIARAGQQGQAAVADALSPAQVREMIAARQAQPGWSSPEESAAYASWQGQNAVAGVTPPRGPAGWYAPPSTAPTATTETTNPNQGYAPSAKRASHWGLKAVEGELDKEPE